jgi:4-hydroxy 2-oxovalerate aldolase
MIALECLVRDGGYYTNWEFNIDLINKYLKVMEQVKIDAVEIGFRSPHNKQVGAFAKVTDQFIDDNLYIPNIKYFGVMINNSEMNAGLIKKLFCYEDKSHINLVRSAVHFKDIDAAEGVCKDLKNLGYTVGCNLMQAADKSFDEIRSAAEKVYSWGVVDVLYLADSLGGMNHDTIDYAYEAIMSGWSGMVGFHGHNNKGQALSNTLEAVDIGVDWVDSTILGMGRGPGNTETEYLLGELNKRGFGEFELKYIYELAMIDFFNLKEQYNWGPSLFYYLSAEFNIHPIYVQNMILDNYSNDTILNAIFYLKDIESSSFNKELFKESLQ